MVVQYPELLFFQKFRLFYSLSHKTTRVRVCRTEMADPVVWILFDVALAPISPSFNTVRTSPERPDYPVWSGYEG